MMSWRPRWVEVACTVLALVVCVAAGWMIGDAVGAWIAAGAWVALAVLYIGGRSNWSCGPVGRRGAGLWVLIAILAGVISPGGVVATCSLCDVYAPELAPWATIGVIWLFPVWAHLASWAWRDSLTRNGMPWLRIAFPAIAWGVAIVTTVAILWYVSHGPQGAF